MRENTYFTSDNIEKLNFLLRIRPDDYCLPDGTLVHLDGLLHDYFKREMRYDNVIFFSPGKGLYFFDEETYDYFCPPAGAVDLTKAPPPSESVTPFRSRRTRNTGDDGPPPAVAESVTRDDVSQQKTLRFTLGFNEAFPRIDMALRDREKKNVIVIKDTVSFLEDSGEGARNAKDTKVNLRNWDNMLLDMGQNRNIIIWVTMKHDNVSVYPYFRDRNAAGNDNAPQLAKNKLTVVETSLIGVGEIKNLINHYRLRSREEDGRRVMCGMRVNFSDYESLCAHIAEKMLRYELALRDLCDMFEWVIEHRAVLNEKSFSAALSAKLRVLKIKEEKEETYSEALKRYDRQKYVLEFIENVKRTAEGFGVNELRASGNDSRLDPPPKTRFQEVLARQQNAFNVHLALVGPPGTGKTTFAKIIAKAYRELGILPTEKFVKVTRADLVGGYIGQTALKTRAAIERAMGGTLFIDEAYALAREGASGQDFGLEAIDTIVEAMTDHMGEFAVIIAGYESDIKKMISTNEGLQSRFSAIIRMEPYPMETLARKFESTVSGIVNDFRDIEHIDIAPRIKEHMTEFLTALEHDYDVHKENGRSGWASMRTVIQLATNAVNNCSRRLSAQKQTRGTLEADDFPEKERAILLSVLSGQTAQEQGQEQPPAAAEQSAFVPRPKKLFERAQIAEWTEYNPVTMLRRMGGGASPSEMRKLYQDAVVFLFSRGGMTGTGCLISPAGHILTAKHVAIEVDSVRIFRSVGKSTVYSDHPVTMRAASASQDIAVMQISDGTPTPFYAPIWQEGREKYAEKETEVSIMGFPFGVQAIDGALLYKGIVAGVSMDMTHEDDLKGTAILNLQIEGKRGNSGSPLLNDNMEIVGVFVASLYMKGDITEEINRALPIKYFFDEFVG